METYQHSQRIREPTDAEIRNESAAAAKAIVEKPYVHSASSSPSHEFSFTISLDFSTTSETTTTTTESSSSPSLTPRTTKTTATTAAPALAIDLSPADEIFFHGRLLPLHFTSHLQSSSPRTSTQSLDSFTLPIKGEKSFTKDDKVNTSEQATSTADSIRNNIVSCSSRTTSEDNLCRKNIAKSKSFNLFGLPKRKKGSETDNDRTYNNEESENCNKRKLKFEVTQFLKRYLNMVKPLFSATRAVKRNTTGRARRQCYSFSSAPRGRNTEIMRGMRRGEYSAPASMRTSPGNSGLLLATAGSAASPVSESTMEELQAAIQAAIAHCKNSVANEEKGKGKSLDQLSASSDVSCCHS